MSACERACGKGGSKTVCTKDKARDDASASLPMPITRSASSEELREDSETDLKVLGNENRFQRNSVILWQRSQFFTPGCICFSCKTDALLNASLHGCICGCIFVWMHIQIHPEDVRLDAWMHPKTRLQVIAQR